LSQYNVISIATHGLVRGDLDSLKGAALVLTPTIQETANPLNDGLLTATELTAYDLNARHAGLTPCNTANFDAQLLAGQVQGLYMAFALAGIPTVVASLWPVESTTSQRLMVGLFERLTQETSASVSEAFADTLRDAIRNPASTEFSHPR